MTEKVTGEPEQLNPEYRALLAEMMTVLREQGEAAIENECHTFKFARMLTLAPESYYTLLEESKPGAAKEWRAWAANQIERHDYAEFFALLKRVGDIRRAEGDEALDGPEHAGLFVRLMRTAPPRYRAEADALVEQSGLVPPATHVNEDGEPVFSVQQIAEKLGVAVEEVDAFVGQHINPEALYRGEVHPIQ